MLIFFPFNLSYLIILIIVVSKLSSPPQTSDNYVIHFKKNYNYNLK